MDDDKITLEEHYILEAYRLLNDEEKEFIMWLSGLAAAGMMSDKDFKNVLWNLVRNTIENKALWRFNKNQIIQKKVII